MGTTLLKRIGLLRELSDADLRVLADCSNRVCFRSDEETGNFKIRDRLRRRGLAIGEFQRRHFSESIQLAQQRPSGLRSSPKD